MSRPGRVPRGRASAPGEAWAGSAPGRVPRGEDLSSTEARGTHGACGIGAERPGGAGAGAAGTGCAERGPVEAELHIRPGPVIGGSAESCGNIPAFNAGEILPCAGRPSLHMGRASPGSRRFARPPESQGKPGIGPRGRPRPMCNFTRTARGDPHNRRTIRTRGPVPARTARPCGRGSGPHRLGARDDRRAGCLLPAPPDPATISPAARRPATRTSRGAAPARPAARSRPAPDGPAPRR